MAVTLDQFRAAAKTGGKIRFVDGNEKKGLHVTGIRWKFWRAFVGHRTGVLRLPARAAPEGNRQVVDAFVKLVQKEYGPSGRDLAMKRLAATIRERRPLRGRDVDVVLRAAGRMLRDNAGNNERIADRICGDNARDAYGFGPLLSGTTFCHDSDLDDEIRRSFHEEDPGRIRGELRRYLLEDKQAGDGGRNRLEIGGAFLKQARPKLVKLAIENHNRRIRASFSMPGKKGYEGVLRETCGDLRMPWDLNLSEVNPPLFLNDAISCAIEDLHDWTGAILPVSAETARRVAREQMGPFLADVKQRLDGIQGAFQGGEITGDQRAALRGIAVRYHDARCDVWSLFERTGERWTALGRLAERILPVMGDVYGDRDRAEAVLTAAALLVNSRREVLAGGDGREPVSLADAWRGVFGEDMPGDVGLENFAGRMKEAAFRRYEERIREIPAVAGQIGHESEDIVRERFRSGTVLSDIPFRTQMDKIGGYSPLGIGDFAGPQSLKFSEKEIADAPKEVPKDFYRFGTSCRFVVERQNGFDLHINPRQRLMLKGPGSRERNQEIGIMAAELVEAVRNLADRRRQGLAACRFFILSSFGHCIYALDALGLSMREKDLSKVEVRRDSNGTDLVIDFDSAANSPVAFHMKVRIDREGSSRIVEFDLARNLRQDVAEFRENLIDELNTLTNPDRVPGGGSPAGVSFRNLFRGLGRGYLEGLGREVRASIAPFPEHPPDPVNPPAVQEFRAGIAGAMVRAVAGSAGRMPLKIREVLDAARRLCTEHAGGFPDIWRSVVNNMVLLRGIVPWTLMPIAEDMMKQGSPMAVHIAGAANLVQKVFSGTLPDMEACRGLNELRGDAARFLDSVSRV